MHRWRRASFLLILAVGSSIAETVQNVQDYKTIPESAVHTAELRADTGKLDYESALRPAVHKKRSIANIARLLLGGNVPPNHPLVKYPEPKAWNLANNIAASLSGASGLVTSASTQSEGWARQPGSALQNIQQLFETKAKIIPYTGQVATGLTGLASVKGDLIRQIHSISTQAIAQAAAEAAARALASAAAAHAVTNSIAHSVSPGAQTGIKGGWSSYQNTYLDPPGKTPGEQPGPPYHDSSAHINHYQAPPAAYNPYAAAPAATPPPTAPSYPSPAAYPVQPQIQQPYQSGYYTLYNTQPSTNSAQTPYTPAPPVAHARPTLSPNTLIATTPSGYSPSLSQPLLPLLRESKALPVIVYAPSSNNTPFTSSRRTVPADIFGRHAAQPSSTSSLLSSISSLLAASTAAYNAAFTGGSPAQQQQSSAILSNLLSSASSTFPTASVPRATSPISSPSISSPSITSAAYSNGYQQQSVNALPQGSSNYGGIAGSVGTGQLHHYQAASPYSSEARAASINAPSNPFNQHVTGHVGTSYAQLGTNPYAPQSVQSSPQFGGGLAGPAAAIANGGIGTSRYSTTGVGYQPGSGGPGYTGNHVGARPSPGHVSGWNTQHAGSSASPSAWLGSPNIYPPGYTGQAPGNINNSPGGFGGPAATQFTLAAGSSLAQPTYSAASPNPYQPSAVNPYAQAQSALYSQQPSQLNSNPSGYQSANANSNGIGGIRNPDITQRHDTQDLTQSATILGGDYDDDGGEDDSNHHSYQQIQRRNKPVPNNSYSSSRYPSPSKKRPTKQRQNNHSYSSGSKSSEHGRNNNHHHHSKSQHGNSARKAAEENGKRVIPTGSKKGSHIDSAVDVVDASVDDYFYEGEGHLDSDESSNLNTDPDTHKNRWRTKNPSGQRPNTFHNHNSNGRWRGKTAHTKQAPPKNVRGNGGGSEGLRSQPGQTKGGSNKNHGNKKVSPNSDREQAEQGKRHQQGKNGGSKTEAAHLYRERTRPEKQQQSSEYKSRDVYTTLPEFVFRVGERPDVFLRPTGGKRKQRISLGGRGALHPRVGETDGNGSSSSSSTTKKEALDTASSSHIYDETFTRESSPKANLEKSRGSSGTVTDKSSRGGEEEELVGSGETVDETARADFVSDQVASDSGFITSEEFDPEEREAFVDDVYADQHDQPYHQPQRRQEENEAGTESESIETVSEDDDNDDDLVDKK